MSLELKYKQKFIKYKTKYLGLKNSIVQIGGNTFVTIPNNGTADGNMTNQCAWISVRDYLNFTKGITNLKIFDDLKKPFGLGPELNNTEFDLTDSKMAAAMTALAKKYNITLCFLQVNNTTKKIELYSLKDNGNVECIQGLINPGQKEVVHIASYGSHFALIISGPGFSLTKNPKSDITLAATMPFPVIPKYDLAGEAIKMGVPKCTTIDCIINLLSMAGAGPSDCYALSVKSLRKIKANDATWASMNNDQKKTAISTGSIANKVPLGPYYVLSIFGVRDKVIQILKL